MMLIIDVRLIVFLFKKLYFIALRMYDFDSILLHCTKLFIRQSINRDQIFDVTFKPPHH